MFKSEKRVRLEIAEALREVSYDILLSSRDWSPEKIAIISDCFGISIKVTEGYKPVPLAQWQLSDWNE